jgi:hypothetical protein
MVFISMSKVGRTIDVLFVLAVHRMCALQGPDDAAAIERLARIQKLLSSGPGGLLQPAALAASAADGNDSNSEYLVLPFSTTQAATFRQLEEVTSAQLESMLASQKKGLSPELFNLIESEFEAFSSGGGGGSSSSSSSSSGQGVDSSPVLLKESPLLPQLIEYCDQRMTMLSAPPERLAAIEQV